MSRAGKKDVLAAGGRKMVIQGAAVPGADENIFRNVAPEGSREEVIVDTTPQVKTQKMKFIPKNKHILVRRDEANALSTTIIMDNVEKEQNNTGLVLETNSVDYPVGTRVVFGKYSGTEYRLNGEVLLIMRDEEVQGLLVKADLDTEESFEVFPPLTIKTIARA